MTSTLDVRKTRDPRGVTVAITLLRVSLVLVLGVCLWTAARAKAANIEYLMVPSAAMGRDIPVAFAGGGPHAVILLDAFNAAPDVSNWISAGSAMNSLAGKGISVAAPAGGAWSLYTDWEQDGSRQWETFLSGELPDWLAGNKGLASGGHGIVGAAQGGTGALRVATFHPDHYRFAGSLSGFLTPSATTLNGAITAGPGAVRRRRHSEDVGDAAAGPVEVARPDAHVQLLADNNTRLWVYCPATLTCSDPAAMIGYCDQAQGSNRVFYQHYRSVGGHNGHFDFPTGGNHDWSSWGRQLAAIAPDLVATIR